MRVRLIRYIYVILGVIDHIHVFNYEIRNIVLFYFFRLLLLTILICSHCVLNILAFHVQLFLLLRFLFLLQGSPSCSAVIMNGHS